MQPERFDALLAELHAIRMVLAWALVFVAVTAAVSFIRLLRQLGAYAERDYGDRLTVKMEQLFETDQLAALEQVCRDRLASHPNHAMALWYLARALHVRGEQASALETFRRLRRIHPSWARDHIDPFIAELTAKDVAPRTDH